MAKTPIDDFIEKISAINDTDYGDFMRKANSYLIELDEEIYDDIPEPVQELLDELKTEIQFYPNWDIKSTRRRTILMAERIKEELVQSSPGLRKRPVNLKLLTNY